MQPSTVHSETHGPSAAIFGLAHLLGIELMPRIRSWQDLRLFRPDPAVRYDHIDALFTAAVDWPLIEAHLPDMLRVGHYEGRGWRGFHHHASLCIAAYGFLVAERCLFPPQARFTRRRLTPPALPEGFRPRGTPDPA